MQRVSIIDASLQPTDGSGISCNACSKSSWLKHAALSVQNEALACQLPLEQLVLDDPTAICCCIEPASMYWLNVNGAGWMKINCCSATGCC